MTDDTVGTTTEGTDERYSVLAALKGMFSFFTILPINIGMREVHAMNRKFWLIPFVGIFYGALAALEFRILHEYMSSTLLTAAIVLFTLQAFNRFLHLDGLLDVGDGLTVAGSQEDHNRALKDSTIGSGAFATGLFVYLITLISMSQIYTGTSMAIGFASIMVMTEVLSRNAQVFAAASGIAGNGMAGESVRSTGIRSALLSTSISVALILVSEHVIMSFVPTGPYDPAYMPICLVAGIIASSLWATLFAKKANRTFGIVNGDILGAVNETTRLVLLLVFTVILAVMV